MIRRLKAAWLFLRYPIYAEEADGEGYWTEDDARYLETFFRSATGHKLRKLLANYAIRTALDVVRTKEGNPYHVGIGAGIDLGVRAIDNYFPQATAHSGNSEEAEHEGAAFLEQQAL